MVDVKIVEKKPRCNFCKGQEVIYNPSGGNKNIAFLEVCRCVEEKCICDKKPPYFYKDENSNTLKECPCKSARSKIDRIRRLFAASNIPLKYRYRRISEFQLPKDADSSMVIALDEALHFLDLFQKDEFHRGLYFFGPPGTGKTMLSCLILNEMVLRYGKDVQYIKITRDFFNTIRASFNSESTTYGRGDDIFHALARKELLVVDDFGVQSDSEWEKRTLYDLIDSRYESQSPTIITSNVAPEEWKSLFEGRVFSRLKEMTRFLPMIADDYRNRYQSKS